MSQQRTGISWTDTTWNPIVGCSKISAGCDHCWAERMARLHYHSELPNGRPSFEFGWDGYVRLFHERLEQPLHWRKPRRIAVGLMGDLFHPEVPVYFQEKVFRAAISANQHIFQFLTKRADALAWRIPMVMNRIYGAPDNWTMPRNIWLGVSCENQAAWDERVPLLSQTPAAVRYVSCEPLLGEIYSRDLRTQLIDWVIVGGESGPGARPMHPGWARSLRDQCQAARVPLHFKQWGEWAPRDWRHNGLIPGIDCWLWQDGTTHEIASHEMPSNIDTVALMRRIGKKSAGRLLDGKEWLEFPEIRK